jgi:Fe-S oxidoreductase
VLDAGCCGLAGSFGFRADHEPLSRLVGEEQWLPKVRAAVGEGTDVTLVLDGVGCTMQLERLSGLEPSALISVVGRALETPSGADQARAR